MAKDNKKYLCRYCGVKTSRVDCVCHACSEKRVLVRKLLKMVRDTAESVRGRSEEE